MKKMPQPVEPDWATALAHASWLRGGRVMMMLGCVAGCCLLAGVANAERVAAAVNTRSVQPERELVRLIENPPARSSGQVAYDARDDHGLSLGLLDPIPDPRGGYLGVYEFALGGTAPQSFDVALGRSADLIHWRRVGIIDMEANSPTLRPIPGNPGYLLAEEKYSAADPYDHLRVRYYRSLADVLANRVAAQVDLPRRYSPYANGTPSFMSISWHGSLKRSVIRLGFHYLPAAAGPGSQGPDREALGTLFGFGDWTTRKDHLVDTLLDPVNLDGKHGDRRQFSFDRRLWRIYEGQTHYELNGFANWRIALYDVTAKRMVPLTMRTAAGAFSTSFGAPTVQLEPSPRRNGRVLVVTMFVFAAGPGEGGELIFYRRA
jgi:hypothetical protein